MERKPRKIAVDFDGTLVKRKGIPTNGALNDCEPTEDAVEAISFFIEKGLDVYILTSRNPEEWDSVRKWLKDNNFPEIRVGNIKEKDTQVIIDDRAIRFTNWQDIRKYFF